MVPHMFFYALPGSWPLATPDTGYTDWPDHAVVPHGACRGKGCEAMDLGCFGGSRTLTPRIINSPDSLLAS